MQRPGARVGGAHVEHLDRRQPALVDTARQLDPGQLQPGLGARRGGAGDEDRAALGGAVAGDRARVIAWVALLLVGGVVLLVDHDQAEVLDRGEDRRARPDADARLAAAQPPPLVGALAGGEGGVQDGEAVAEPSAKACHHLGSETDLGDEDDRPPPLRQRRLDRRQVDLGLARAGDPVQEQLARGASLTVQRGADLRDRRACSGSSSGATESASATPGSSTRGLLRRLRTPAPGGSTSRSPREGVEQYSRATQRPSRTSSAGTPVSSASIGSASRSGARSEDSARSTTTPKHALPPERAPAPRFPPPRRPSRRAGGSRTGPSERGRW